MQLIHADGIFKRLHQELMGCTIDFSQLDPGSFRPELVEFAQSVWTDRVHTEFRSIQVMSRLLTEMLGAGDPLEVYAGIADAIVDEIRHTALCAGVVEALGGTATLPVPLNEPESDEFLALPMAQRALSTSLAMLVVSETLSTGFITDLHERCNNPVIKSVLGTTLADEDTHHEFGWSYVEASMSRFDAQSHDMWKLVVQVTLAPHLARAEETLSGIPLESRHLDAWPEPELATLGLLSPEREALVFQNTYQRQLAPNLRRLSLI